MLLGVAAQLIILSTRLNAAKLSGREHYLELQFLNLVLLHFTLFSLLE